MSPSAPFDSPGNGRWLLATLAAVALVQAGFLLLPGPFWDGWIYHVLFERHARQAFMDPFVANGRPLGGWILWWAMTLLGVTMGPKLVSAAALLGAAAALFCALRVRERLPPSGAFLVAVIAVTVPATQTALSSSALQFFAGFLAYFCGLYAFSLAAARAGACRALLYAVALALAACSVMLAEASLALLPVYPLAWLVVQRGWGELANWRATLRALLLHSGPLLAGAVALLATFWLFPTLGTYEGAHRVQANPLEWLKVGGLFAVALAGSELLLLLGLAWVARTGTPLGAFKSSALLGALAVLALGILPYLAGGRWPAILGWGTRTLLFSGLGLGLAAWVLLRHWTEALPARRQRNALWLLCVAAIACTLCRIPLWAARQVRDDGLRVALTQGPIPAQTDAIWIHDPTWLIASPYRFYESTALVQLATGRSDLLALAAAPDEAAALAEADHSLRKEHRLVTGNRKPLCQADLTIGPLPVTWPASATIGLLRRAFSSQEAYTHWLRGRVPVQIALRKGCGQPETAKTAIKEN